MVGIQGGLAACIREIRRKVVEIPAVAKDVMWLVAKQSDGFQYTGALVLYITRQNHEVLQPTFLNELEEDVLKIKRGRTSKTKCVVLCGCNARDR